MMQIGDTARIYIPPETCETTDINRILAKKYNNMVSRVTKVKSFYRNDEKHTQIGTYYELEGFESPKGIPYSFDSSWVHPAEEV